MFNFKEFPDLNDQEIKLIAKSYDQPDHEKKQTARYEFSIVLIESNSEVGRVYFAVDTSLRQYLRGHISYGVSLEYRGNNYAFKACKLIKKVASAHNFNKLYIGSSIDNIASRITIEKLGARRVTADDVPNVDLLDKLLFEKIDMYVWNISDKGHLD